MDIDYTFGGHAVHYHVLLVSCASEDHEDFVQSYTDLDKSAVPCMYKYDVYCFDEKLYEPEWDTTGSVDASGLSKTEACILARKNNLYALLRTLPYKECLLLVAQNIEEYNLSGKIYDMIHALQCAAHHICKEEEERNMIASEKEAIAKRETVLDIKYERTV